MKYPHIALIGKARAGKDTIAERLVSRFQYTRLAFADPLKDMLLRVDPLVSHSLRLSEVVGAKGWEVAKDEHPESRRLLQYFGQNLRDHDPDFWVRMLMEKVQTADRWGLPVVVSDVRYPNEAAALRKAGFRLVRVLRGGLAGGTPQAPAHESETVQDEIFADRTVFNLSTLEALRAEADALVK
ncbi:hypothetical protein OU787_17375 [Kitasatospora sp. YST-16]|uniref:hypothetical protein n=1 Tax=Kitasatospora sp. YST-16 TaxID=2998080 RepID=UPI0022837950|nr:hypothetical protein [Kitasatospora sp. YST-16]WAL73121.1 hypothetical protein OU787_17375 [Kitasatospora sp. YST-16]WNW39175.1 hypothetical protein RKE32_17340 [Streptomyces sp. Li-HN-5-13]